MTRPEDWPELMLDLENLEMVAFEGAGVTGVLYTGAMRALEEEGLLASVKRFAGTSSGSIVATAAALGYRGKKLQEIALKQDFRVFCRTNGYWLRHLKSNLSRNGLFSGGEMRRWINNLCGKRIGQPNLTFADLEAYRERARAGDKEFFKEKYRLAMQHKRFFRKHSRDPRSFMYEFERETEDASIEAMMEIACRFRGLDVAVTELRQAENGEIAEHPAMFNHLQSPDLPIADAVRASSSYPYVFREALIVDKDGVERRYTDGAYTCPIPMNLIDEKGEPNRRVLGFTSSYFDSHPRQVHRPTAAEKKLKQFLIYAVGKATKQRLGIEGKTPTQVGKRLIRRDEIRFLSAGQELVPKEDKQRIIPLNRFGIAGANFHITNEEKRRLIEAAYQETKAEITRWRENKPLS